MAIKLFQSQTSMFCEKVRIVLAMKYNIECVIDSTVISAWLEKDFTGNSIYPEGSNNKGLCLALEDWSDEVLVHANHAVRRADTPEAKKKADEEGTAHFNNLEQMHA